MSSKTRQSRTPSTSTTASMGHHMSYTEQAPTRLVEFTHENAEAILKKLKALHKEVTNATLSSKLENGEIVPVSIESSAPFMGMQQQNGRQTNGYASTTNKNSRAASEAGYSVFSVEDGEAKTEKPKKALEPILRARKNLFRSLGKCPLDCREKKTKCRIPHHKQAMEYLRLNYPDAVEYVAWAMVYDADPKQRPSPTTSLAPSMSRNTSQRLEPHPEEDEKTQLMRTVNSLGLSEPTPLQYDTTLDLDLDLSNEDGTLQEYPGLSDNRTFNTNSQNFGNFNNSQRSASVGEYQQTMTRPQLQHYASDNTYNTSDALSDFSLNSPRQSTFANFHSGSTRSHGYPSTPPAPPSLPSWGAMDLLPGNMQPTLQPTGQADSSYVDTVLASCTSVRNRTIIRCNPGGAETCGREFRNMDDAISHIRQNHAEYSIATPPMRAVCCGFFTATTQNCPTCGRQTVLWICGMNLSFESALSSPSDQDYEAMSLDGMWGGGNGGSGYTMGNGNVNGNNNANFNGSYDGGTSNGSGSGSNTSNFNASFSGGLGFGNANGNSSNSANVSRGFGGGMGNGNANVNAFYPSSFNGGFGGGMTGYQ